MQREQSFFHLSLTMLLFMIIAVTTTLAQDFTPPQPHTDERGRAVGNILFSKTPIIRNKEKASQMATTFTGSDQLFAMAYLPSSLEDLGFANGFTLYLHEEDVPDGYSHTYQSIPLKFKPEGEINGDQNFYDIDIFAGQKDAWRVAMTREFLQTFTNYLNDHGKKAQRVYKIKAELLSDGIVRADGAFTLDITKGSAGIQGFHTEHQKAILADTKLPPSKRNDPALAEKIKKVMAAQKVNVQKVVFSSEDWYIERNKSTGVILHRSIAAYIVAKEANGECTYNEVFFKQEYVGNGFSDQVVWKGNGLAAGKILCENTK